MAPTTAAPAKTEQTATRTAKENLKPWLKLLPEHVDGQSPTKYLQASESIDLIVLRYFDFTDPLLFLLIITSTMPVLTLWQHLNMQMKTTKRHSLLHKTWHLQFSKLPLNIHGANKHMIEKSFIVKIDLNFFKDPKKKDHALLHTKIVSQTGNLQNLISNII